MSDKIYTPTAIATLDGPGVGRNKQGHLCCGCCCDTRRAVIVVDIIQLCASGLALLGLMVGFSMIGFAEQHAEEFDDDQMEQSVEQLKSTPIGWLLILLLVQTVLHVLGIIGAIHYNAKFIMCAIVSYVIQFARGLLCSILWPW